MMRGIRGAVKLRANDKESIKEDVQALIRKIMKLNNLKLENIISIFFTLTPDINADFPALHVRTMGEGWEMVPCLCAQEINVPGEMDRCMRVLVLANIDKRMDQIQNVYLGETSIYRPEISRES